KQFCLELYLKDPKAYRHLTNIFHLLTKCTLNRYIQNITFKTGINKNINTFSVAFSRDNCNTHFGDKNRIGKNNVYAKYFFCLPQFIHGLPFQKIKN
ncbi:hypothetical protein ALC57_11678, partial [Trachymyrmex cornetzi]